MENCLAKVTLVSDTGMARDACTNTFVITEIDEEVSSPDGSPLEIARAIIGFYNTVPTGGLTYVAASFSPVLNIGPSACKIDLYNLDGHLDGSNMGSPIEQFTFQLAAPVGGATPLPSEVAHVLTLRAVGRADQPVEAPDGGDAGTDPDRPRQRYTGRVYLGPLNAQAVDTVAGVARPHASLRDTARLAAKDMNTKLFSDAGAAALGVWSRKDGVVRRVNEVSNDNAFDTQRRRGEQSTLLQTLAI